MFQEALGLLAKARFTNLQGGDMTGSSGSASLYGVYVLYSRHIIKSYLAQDCPVMIRHGVVYKCYLYTATASGCQVTTSCTVNCYSSVFIKVCRLNPAHE